MKVINNIIVILITLLVINSANAQWKLGVICGLNFADLKTDTEVRSRTLIEFGGILEYSIINQLSIVTTPMYIQNGGIKEQTDDQPELKIKGSYLTVPIYLKYSPLYLKVVKPYLFAGPSVGYRLNFKMEGEYAGLNLSADLKNVTEDFDFGLGFGAGVEIPFHILSIIVEGKYYLGLIDQHKNGTFQAEAGGLTIQGQFDDANKFKTRGIQILVGVTFPIGY